ncbi:MAG: hypothetical protein HYX24_03550 [Candidatus Aenigmarchaeota archaeon]|nr:hypothetical protein [Candidatus Aenigmarchaeota archaeon]
MEPQKYEKNDVKYAGTVAAGIASGAIARIAVHEAGHALGCVSLGGVPELTLLDENGNTSITCHNLDYSNFESMGGKFQDYVRNTGAPVAEYAASFALAYLSTRIDEEKHPWLVKGMRIASTTIASFPAFDAVLAAIEETNGYRTDFRELQDLGLPLFVTIPATIAIGAGIAYYNFRKKIKGGKKRHTMVSELTD